MPDPTFLTRDGGDPVAHFEALMGRFMHPSQSSLIEAEAIIREDIRTRTLDGISYDGQPFAPYSPSYAKQKGQENVDLLSKYERQHMLDVFDVRINGDALEAGIFNNEEAAQRAQINNEGGEFRTRAGFSRTKYRSLASQRAAVASGKSLTGHIPARPWLGPSQAALDKAGQAIVRDMLQKEK